MARYSLNLPQQLKRDAERWAASQGVSLDQFILWAVAEKVGGLGRELDDPRFPGITYRRGGAGEPVAVVRGTGLRVRTLAVASRDWGWSAERLAGEYGLTEGQVEEALEFAERHEGEIAGLLAKEARLEPSALGRAREGVDLDRALRLADGLEEAEIARKLERRK